MIIQKKSKGNSVAVIDKITHNKRTELVLSDQWRFLELDVPDINDLNFPPIKGNNSTVS